MKIVLSEADKAEIEEKAKRMAKTFENYMDSVWRSAYKCYQEAFGEKKK